MKILLRCVATICLVGALLVAVFVGLVHRELPRVMQRPIDTTHAQLFRISPGASTAAVARQFEQNGWIPDYRFLILQARLDQVANRIKAGVYEVSPGDSPVTVLERIVAGATKALEVTFIEGSTFSDIVDRLENAPHIVTTLKRTDEGAVMAQLGLEEAHPEGLFFPATYRYEIDTTDRQVLQRAYQRMRDVVAGAWKKRDEALPYTSAYEALIMASIIEKETGQAAERQEIAGVFVRRLQIGMRLQTDPTVIYGLGRQFDGNLRRADLRRDGPYNTYTRGGLPPTPIAMPGQAAIEAALHPAAGKALYFVAKGDGTHYFSRSLREHNNAVKRFQLRR